MGIFCLQYFLRKENPFSPRLGLTGAVWVGAQVPAHLRAPGARERGGWASSAPLADVRAERKLWKSKGGNIFVSSVLKELAGGRGMF